ncbi:hypothetical protein RAMDARK_0497 [Rickettsia amblyommatis str. Darkwater]|nr:hypothetical protein RAMDARK_0497 [Rickettsia amblyommatis str. Darkwater]
MGINFIRGTGLVIIDLRIFNNFYTQNVFITSLQGKNSVVVWLSMSHSCKSRNPEKNNLNWYKNYIFDKINI